MPSLSIIRVYRDLPDALLARSILDSAGIECFLFDENIVRLDWLWSTFVGGVKLIVSEKEAADSNQLLDQQPLESFAVSGVGTFMQPRCPACQSLDVSFQGLIRPIAYASMFAAVPVPVIHSAWKCHSCGVEWHSPEDVKILTLNIKLIGTLSILGLLLTIVAYGYGFRALDGWLWFAFACMSALSVARFAQGRKWVHAFVVGSVCEGFRWLAAGCYWTPRSKVEPGLLNFTVVMLALNAVAFGGAAWMGFTWLATLVIPEREHPQVDPLP